MPFPDGLAGIHRPKDFSKILFSGWNQPPDSAFHWVRSSGIAIDREEAMDYLHFFSPVRISRGQGHPVEEVDSVAEAMVFLRKWPTGRRGPVYQCALNCCSAALSGQMSAEEARKAFTGFARITRLLDDDMALPVAGESMAGVYALRR
jgi:hypothetical protein